MLVKQNKTKQNKKNPAMCQGKVDNSAPNRVSIQDKLYPKTTTTTKKDTKSFSRNKRLEVDRNILKL